MPTRLRGLAVAIGVLALAIAYAQWAVMPGLTPLLAPVLAVVAWFNGPPRREGRSAHEASRV